jgi:hypothetical protein
MMNIITLMMAISVTRENSLCHGKMRSDIDKNDPGRPANDAGSRGSSMYDEDRPPIGVADGGGRPPLVAGLDEPKLFEMVFTGRLVRPIIYSVR